MRISRMNKGDWGTIKAFFDISVSVDVTNEAGEPITSDMTMKGFKLVEGINGLFVGFPSQKGHDDEYYDTIWADTDVKRMVLSLAEKEYSLESVSGIDEEIPF